MTEQELLKAIGEIDEKYIEEAAPGEFRNRDTETEPAGAQVISLPGQEERAARQGGTYGKSGKAGKTARRRRFAAAATVAAAVLLVIVFPKIQRNMITADRSAVQEAAVPAAGDVQEAAAPEEEAVQEAAAPAEMAGGNGAVSSMPAETVPEAAPEALREAPAAKAAQEEAFDAAAEKAFDAAAEEAAPAPAAGMDSGMMAGASANTAAAESASGQQMQGMAAAAMANPFIPCGTLEEAARIAGFSLNLPEETDTDAVTGKAAREMMSRYPVRNITAVMGSMIQVICFDENGTEGFRLRKAAGTEEDITGLYGTFEEKNEEKEGIEYFFRLENGTVRSVSWTADGFSYGMIMEDLESDKASALELADMFMQADRSLKN